MALQLKKKQQSAGPQSIPGADTVIDLRDSSLAATTTAPTPGPAEQNRILQRPSRTQQAQFAGDDRSRRVQVDNKFRHPWIVAAERIVGDVRSTRAAQVTLAVLGVVTPVGWTVLVASGALFISAQTLRWPEFALAAYLCLALFAVCCLAVVGSRPLAVKTELDEQRVRVGHDASGALCAANTGKRWLPSATVELVVGEGNVRFNLPPLRAGSEHHHVFPIPTHRRAVVDIGPARTVFADPFGLIRREVHLMDSQEFFVHPHVVRLPSLDSGLIRDLEGKTTSDPSATDLDFHTLRPYETGDDLRHVHWKSTARLSRPDGETVLMMKQYLDTRRSHLAVVLDANPKAYANEEEFELAVTTAASIAVRAISDDITLTAMATEHVLDDLPMHRTLDGFSRAALSAVKLTTLSHAAHQVAVNASTAMFITGSTCPFLEVRRASAQFPAEVSSVLLRCAPAEKTSRTSMLGMTVLTLASVKELPRLLDTGSTS